MSIEFIKPINGDVLFEVADGELAHGVLYADICVMANPESNITINGVNAQICDDGFFHARVGLDGYRNTVTAVDETTGETSTITLFFFKGGYKTYRMGVDDVIRCFENIYNHRDEYTSIFDDPFLKVYKDVHDAYGTHVHMHIYYETVDGKFNLSMFPDKYKDEFKANSDWLRFSFHSLADQPASPYKNATYEQVIREGELVEREIIRFAGAEVMDSVTSQHWADSNLEGTRAFRDLGFKVIDGYFIFDDEGNPMVSYYLNADQARHAHERDFWVDTEEDIIFVKDDIILNEPFYSLEDIDAELDKLKMAEDHCFMYLLIHEQYFYEDFEVYEPDYRERVFRGVEWCVKNGYRSSWIGDFAFENKGDNIWQRTKK
ncbi:MAG: hypothetical protein IKB50_01090 [Clostridia bacterium]|nr:hypothetical protein [Clostridia bacterium]